jgi:hypothetical protein
MSQRKIFPALSFCMALGLVACGAQESPSINGSTAGVMHALGLEQLDAGTSSAECDIIHAKLVAGADKLEAACKGDTADNVSAECKAAHTQFKANLTALKATPQWSGVVTTPSYQSLKDDYAQYAKAGCSGSH